MSEDEKEVVWLHDRVTTPPFSVGARRETGELIRVLQEGGRLSLPHSRRMPQIGPRCHELRVVDRDQSWRIIYRIDPGHVVVAAVVPKKSRQTPELVKASCRARLRQYDIELRG